MDPDANLARQRRLTTEILSRLDLDKRWGLPDIIQVTDLAELVTALDEWICKGGFLPRDWQTKKKLVEDKEKTMIKYLRLKANVCPHGNQLGDCDACDVEADFAYDTWREDKS